MYESTGHGMRCTMEVDGRRVPLGWHIPVARGRVRCVCPDWYRSVEYNAVQLYVRLLASRTVYPCAVAVRTGFGDAYFSAHDRALWLSLIRFRPELYCACVVIDVGYWMTGRREGGVKLYL